MRRNWHFRMVPLPHRCDQYWPIFRPKTAEMGRLRSSGADFSLVPRAKLTPCILVCVSFARLSDATIVSASIIARSSSLEPPSWAGNGRPYTTEIKFMSIMQPYQCLRCIDLHPFTHFSSFAKLISLCYALLARCPALPGGAPALGPAGNHFALIFYVGVAFDV
jgi:hypothetical protein